MYRIFSSSALAIFAIGSFANACDIDAEQLHKNANGSYYLSLITYENSICACPSETHIPTAREYANIFQTMGAGGVLEVSQYDPANPLSKDYRQINAIDANGQEDHFYYSKVGFRASKNWIPLFQWSSSAAQLSKAAAYAVSFQNGSISIGPRSDWTNDGWCVPNN